MYGQTPLIFPSTKFNADLFRGCLDVCVQTDGRKGRLQQTLRTEANTPKKVKKHHKATRIPQAEKRLKRTFRTKHGTKHVCFYYTNQTLLRGLGILEGCFECERCVRQDLA